MSEVRRDVERRAAVRVLHVGFLAGREQALDLGRVTLGGGGMQAGIDAQVGGVRRDLRECRPRQGTGEKQGEQEREAHQEKVPAG